VILGFLGYSYVMPSPATARENGKKGGRPKGLSRKTLARLAGEQRALQQAEITAERTMLEIGRVAFVDRSQVWRNGQILPFEEWPEEALSLLEGFEVVIKNAAAGDGHTDTVHKVHLAKKLGALELLAKHFALLNHVVKVDFEQSLLDRLDRGRQRVAEARKLLESGKGQR
jgi:hypothetical protein